MTPGETLRATRRLQNQTLKQVAEKTGFTQAYLSQVETGKATPPLSSLKRIANAYGASLVDLLMEQPEAGGVVLRRGDRPKLVLRSGDIVKELLVARQSGRRMEPLLVTIQPRRGSEGVYHHAGEEFGMVLSGELELTAEGTVHHLRRGDTFYLNSTRPHGFRNPSARRVATVLWVITPPSM
jgi:transcriptional regulator with XRE-family HTH domain